MSPRVTLVAGAKLPLGFIGLGLVAFAGAALFAAVQPTLILGAFLHPHVVAWAHLWLPGFLLSICLGAVYQLMPVVLGAELRLRLVWAWTHLGLHAAGVSLLVASFYTGRYGLAGVGGTLITVGILIFCTGILRTFAVSTRRDAPAWSFPLAAGWLGLTVLLGVTMAVNRRTPFLPLSAFNLVKAHAHLGLVGFFLSLLQGTAFQLVPMFTMGTLRRPRLIWAGLLGTQLGLLLLAPGLAWELRPVVVLGAVVLLAAVGCSAVALVETFGTRRRKNLEPGLKAFAIGAAAAGIATLLGVALTVWQTGAGDFQMNLAVGYVVLCVVGGLSFTVLGMLCKIVPFLVWMRAYGPHVGKRPVPLAPSLGSHRLETAWLALHLLGLCATVAAILTQNESLAQAGGVALAGGASCFLVNIARIVRHLWLSPATPAVSMPTVAQRDPKLCPS